MQSVVVADFIDFISQIPLAVGLEVPNGALTATFGLLKNV
jgi:hypothetical protein